MSALITSHTTTALTTSLISQHFLVAAHGSITTASAAAIATTGGGFGAVISILGSVASNVTGLHLTGKVDDVNGSSVTIGPNGSVVTTGPDFTAIYATGDAFSISNAGFVSGDFSALYIGGNGFEITNSGTISSQGTAVFTNHIVPGALGSFHNSGTVNGSVVHMVGSVLLTNSGTIQAHEVAVFFNAGGGETLTLDNSGSILSDGTAVQMLDGTLSTARIDNSGDITGDLQLASGNDAVFNSGRINGDVVTGNGANSLRNHGSIDGDVVFGIGADTFINRGTVTGSINGASGTDVLKSWIDVSDVLNFETVILFGRQNLDATLDGTATRLIGNHGDNALDAGGGNDNVFGLAGDDIVIGGSGKDRLSGGAGRDSFVFTSTGHSGTTAATRDRILDFTRGQDKIDLSDMAGGKFAWIGKSAFDGSGNAELRYQTAGKHALVQIDKNGDGTIDSTILVENTPALGAGDFLL